MKALSFLYWIIVLQAMITIVSMGHPWDRQVGDQRTIADLEMIGTRKSALGSLSSFSASNKLIRSKRNEQNETEEIPTRHARHRKRRRCRNRSTCLRGSSATKVFPLQNDTASFDQASNERKEDHDASNTVVDIEEELRDRSGMNVRVQESYNETRKEDYDVTDGDGEEGRTDPKGRTVVNDGLPDDESTDSYDERSLSSKIEPEGTPPSSGIKDLPKRDEIDDSTDYFSTIYSAINDQVAIHESLGVLLSKLFQGLRNVTATDRRDILKELNFVNGTNEDPCQKWLNSKDRLEQVFLGGLASLPACPCQYPSNIFYDDNIWDESRKRYFRWRDVSGDSQRLDVYKPGAAYCVRSLLTQGSGSAAAQHCCYDRRRKLLTRGSGAGTPNFVSPEISPILHKRIDVLPWRLCKGDFSRYNEVRPPNNDNGCEANPEDEEYQRQIDSTKYY